MSDLEFHVDVANKMLVYDEHFLMLSDYLCRASIEEPLPKPSRIMIHLEYYEQMHPATMACEVERVLRFLKEVDNFETKFLSMNHPPRSYRITLSGGFKARISYDAGKK